MAEWDLQNQQLYTITNSGANVKNAMTQPSNVKWRARVAYTLQLVVKSGLNNKNTPDLTTLLAFISLHVKLRQRVTVTSKNPGFQHILHRISMFNSASYLIL